MQVIEPGRWQARCRSRNGSRVQDVDMLLVGEQEVGSWVLVFLGAAREVLDEATAFQISDALLAVESVMQGEAPDEALFADLIDREPQLPEFLLKERH